MSAVVYIESLGCSKNRVDSEIMLGSLASHFFRITAEPKQAEVIIVNTCGFLTSAVNESIERVLELAEQKEHGVCKKLIVAGCLAERYKESIFEELPEVDGLIGTSDYTKILDCVQNTLLEEERYSYLPDKPGYAFANFESRRILSTDKHYAYLKIAEGCSNLCSFCNIPKLRGKMRSRPIPHIQAEYESLIKRNIKEINIISQDSSSYGRDLPNRKADLLSLIDSLLEGNDHDHWIRLFYSYPNTYPEALFERMKRYPQLTAYCDMPFQHISDKILKDMRRNITAKRIRQILELAERQVEDIAFRTTFIVGFPTESEKDFMELLRFVEQGYFRHLGVFTYSHEDNILSARFGDPLPAEEKEERKKSLMEAQQRVLAKRNQHEIGKIHKVLIEGTAPETELLLQGRTEYQSVEVDGRVLINDGVANIGSFSRVFIEEAHPYDLVGRIVDADQDKAA